MSRHVPSRAILRHLARLCNPHAPIPITRPSLCTASRHAHHSSLTSQHRYLSTTPSHRQTLDSTQATQPTPPSAPTLPDITSYYTLFPHTLPHGAPPSGPFAIHLPSLRQEFLRLQSLYHPDKYQPPQTPSSSAAPSQTNLSALSSLLNSAYRTLSSPLLRAQYLLLNQHNIDVTSEDNSTHTANPTTLTEVMDAQEAIESASTQSQIDELKSQNRRRIQETEAKMGRAFEDDDIETARQECVRLKYWVSLQEGLDGWEAGREVRLVH